MARIDELRATFGLAPDPAGARFLDRPCLTLMPAALEDPQLYVTQDGAHRAGELGRELDAARRGLDEALARWETATRSAEVGN